MFLLFSFFYLAVGPLNLIVFELLQNLKVFTLQVYILNKLSLHIIFFTELIINYFKQTFTNFKKSNQDLLHL